MIQISNKIFCEKFLTQLDIETKILPNPYYDYPYMIIKNFLSKKICDEITTSTQKKDDAIDAKVRKKSILIKEENLNKKIRNTKIHKLSPFYENIYLKNFTKHQKDIENFFSLALTTSTKIQTLEYTKGSFYKAHSDDSNVLLKDDELVGFIPVAPQRKITSVLFTTSYSKKKTKNSFQGGELVFNYLYDEDGKKIHLEPQAGDMIVFLSNPYFTHEVLEIKDGYRLSLVQWHDAIIN